MLTKNKKKEQVLIPQNRVRAKHLFRLQIQEQEEPLICHCQCPQTAKTTKVHRCQKSCYILMVLPGNTHSRKTLANWNNENKNIDANCTTGLQEISIVLNSWLIKSVILHYVSVAFANFILSKNWWGRRRRYHSSMEEISAVLQVTRADDIEFWMIVNNIISNSCDSNKLHTIYSLAYINATIVSSNIILLTNSHVGRQKIKLVIFGHFPLIFVL